VADGRVSPGGDRWALICCAIEDAASHTHTTSETQLDKDTTKTLNSAESTKIHFFIHLFYSIHLKFKMFVNLQFIDLKLIVSDSDPDIYVYIYTYIFHK